MSSLVEQISPAYIGAARIDLSLESPLEQARARRQIAITVGTDRCAPQGATPPFRMSVQGPSESSYYERYYTTIPSRIAFTPSEGGIHSVTLAELYHNRWFGNLTLTVDGERL